MDPKSLSNLDPKLRETYERVMGTPNAAGSPTPTPLSSTPTPSPSPTLADGGAPTQVTATATVSTPDGTISQATTGPVPTTPAQPVNPWQNQTQSAPNPFTPTGQSLPSPAAVAGQGKETSPMLRVLYIIGAVVFFALYTVFWIKVFKLPFLF